MPLKFLGQEAGSLPRIDRYELIAEIASGGMASVYLARLVGMGGFERFFAIKRLHPHLGNEQDFVSMFLDEARIVAGIRHQHVVPVLEVGASEHGYYLVMEYIEGDTLAALLSQSMGNEHPMPKVVAIRIILDILLGLHAAHEHVDADGNPIGLVHRDVSPQNILVDINGVARIADFGVAHATSRLSSTRSGQLKGKVAYMAPEQARGQVVTPRSDVFAVGIVLWEALCKRRLFLADNEAVTLNRLIFEPIPLLREVNPSLPEGLERVVARALQREQDRRYPSAADMAEDLQYVARECHVLGSAAQVKTYVRNTIGPRIERRRTTIRQHLSKLTSSEATGPAVPTALERPNFGLVKPPDSSVSSAAMALPSPISEPTGPMGQGLLQPAQGVSRRPVVIAVASVLGLVAVVALVFAMKDRSPTPDGVAASEPFAPQVSANAMGHPDEDLSPSASASVVPEPSAIASPETTRPTLSTKATTRSHTPPKPASDVTAKSTPSEPKPKKLPIVDPDVPAAEDDMKRNPYR